MKKLTSIHATKSWLKTSTLLLGLLILASCEQTEKEIQPDPPIINPLTSFEYTQDPENAFKFTFKNKSDKYVRQEWRFGDDTLRTEKEPVHIYKAPGNYLIDLKSFSETGHVSRSQVKLTIHPDSVAQIVGNRVGLQNEVKFKIILKAPIASVLWTFNDLKPVGTSTEMEPVKPYLPGTLNKVTARVTSTDGSVVTVSQANATIHGIVKDITREREGYTITAENNYSTGENSTKLLDGDINSKFVMGGRDERKFTYPLATSITYKKARIAKMYAVGSAENLQTRDPKSWELHGSNDGVTWELLDTRTMPKNFYDMMVDKGATGDAQRYRQLFYFSLVNTKAFTKYRFSITSNWGDPALQINEFRLFE